MRQRKVAFYAAAIGASAFALSACSAGTSPTTPDASETADGATASAEKPANADTLVMKVAFNQPETHPQYIVMDELGDKLYEATDGAYDVEVFPNETLGAQRETIELVQAGTLEMAYVAGPLLENFNPDFVAFNLPFVFDSPEHQSATTNDPAIVGDLYDSLVDQGIKVVSAFHGGVRSVYNSEKPINTPEDLAGMKIRVIESDTNIEMMSLMGGTGTPMGQGEVYTAIQSGVIDGGENNELIFAGLKHDEVAPYYSYTRHLMFPDYLIISPAIYDAMSPEVQQIFTDLLAEARVEEAKLWKEQVGQAKADAEAAGAVFNEVDSAAFAEAIAPLTESRLTSETAKSLYDQVRAAAK